MSPRDPSSSRPGTILLLVPGFPADEEDTQCLPGVQSYVRALRARTNADSTHLAVVAFQYPYRKECYLWNDVPIYPVGGANRPFPRKLLTWGRAIRRTLDLMEGNEPAVIHSFWLGECTLIGQWISRWTRSSQIATVPGQDARSGNRYLRWIDLDRCTVAGGSSLVDRTLRRTTGQGVDAVIPLGLDAHRMPAGSGYRSRPVDLLGVGSLNAVKNFGMFVEVVDALRDSHPHLRAVIIGDGPERDRLERAIRERGLEDHLELAGALPRERVLERMSASRILLHTAAYDAQPYVFLEALACGMHVVSTPVGFEGPTDRVHFADSVREVGRRLEHLLRQDLPHEAVSVPTARETADRYLELYGLPY